MVKRDKYFKNPSASQGTRIATPQDAPGAAVDYPVFCFKHLHKGDYGVDVCDKEERAALMSQIAKLGTLTWADIRLLPRHGMGAEKIQRNQIKTSLPGYLKNDVNEFLAFRFIAKKPFVGHLDGHLFHVLFIDRDFSLYNH